ncbi:MAG: hypothetical protein MUC36_02075 [Planctomycetes bacterium]|jgi:hypothetical protein|nr:hypothetical protein [Planctomycetota bacterium]
MRHRCAVLGSLLLLADAYAQTGTELGDRETKLHATAGQTLLAFARSAEGNKMFARAKTCYEALLRDYDPDHKPAAAALAAPGREWTDQGTPAQQRTVEQAWSVVCKKLAPLHRELGLAMVAADDLVRGPHHLQLCLAYDPADRAAHEALGHESFRGVHGTHEQIAFCKRFEAIEQKGKELAAATYEPAALPVDQAPIEFRNARLAVQGARTRQWKVWTTSAAAETASNAAQWAERAQDLLDFVLCGGPQRRAARIDGKPVAWVGLLRSDAEWQAFFTGNPELMQKLKLTAPPGGESFRFESSQGPAEVFRHPESLDADHIIAHVAMWGFANQHNEGLGQGLVHAMTTLLVGTTLTWFGEEPKTRAGNQKPVARDEKAWDQRLREEIRAGKDWPLVQVPREKLSSYREVVRVKSWSFVRWLMARYPDTWTRALQAIVTAQNPMPEQIEQVFQQEFGLPLPQIEAEWREWARGESALAKATRSGG